MVTLHNCIQTNIIVKKIKILKKPETSKRIDSSCSFNNATELVLSD